MTSSNSPELLNEVFRIPSQHRFFTGTGRSSPSYICDDACVFGLGTSPDRPLNFIPPETKGLYFYYGAGIKNLLEEILKLDLVNNLEYLVIGITHNNAKDYADYSEISKILSGTYFPKLKFFEYGIDELIANEHCIYGNLYDITAILGNMPNLEKLYLFGNFELTKPVTLPQLTDMEVLMDDWNLHINGGKITNDTLQHLLTSEFESLRLLSLYLDFNDENYEYTIPQTFLTGRHTPKLELFELKGKFEIGTKLQITASAFLKSQLTHDFDMSGINEPPI
jgi:hypothetical protein